jgi:beta-mannosidase
VELLDENGRQLDSYGMRIGLRTLRLDTGQDEWGENFRFYINGIPIFAKGSNWIPSDSFVQRTTREDLGFYIQSAKRANMNMLRVWGGGYYESDAFYDWCDEYGILVWQDFAFACVSYPLYYADFVENVRQEVTDNVLRLRHRACLALWCGNNEIQMGSDLLGKYKDPNHISLEAEFFHHTLRGWVEALDADTPYWPGSPNSGTPEQKTNDLDRGDTHLYQVWHGMRRLEAFRELPTRFCSEFGMESFPSMRAIRSFTDEKDPTVFSPVMKAHQKSGSGNEKILFYILSKYRNPARFADFVYLSQLIQSETVRMATEQWRRQMGRCNGALYWQYNDCWPTASWASIDYSRQYKAIQYRARYFNSMLCVSADMQMCHADIYIINEYPTARRCLLHWRLVRLAGGDIARGDLQVLAPPCCAENVFRLDFARHLNGVARKNAALLLNLEAEEETRSEQNNLLVADRTARLLPPGLCAKMTLKAGRDAWMGRIELEAKCYARYVYVEIDGVTEPLSDNFFDIEGGGTKTIAFEAPRELAKTELRKGLRMRSLFDVQPEGSRLNDKLLQLAMFLKKQNLISYFVFRNM